ncbi:DUF3526 domain-containing protein [Tenacibaculum aestuariivivum]|uniref:DUF3526 domain-containing protein n=1 Tax=Tenacibaculum aestuariivivum TaxID=2006131 RepID=UPI003AB7BE0D
MYRLLIKQFIRSKTMLLAFAVLLLLGILSIYTGKQFLNIQQQNIEKAIIQQKKDIETLTIHHKNDLGLLLYYLKFSFIKKHQPLAAIAIGQSDLNTQIQNINILNLEGQKYNTDLVNPMRLQVGNLDLSFIIIFLLPLVIIALSFNILSEDIENGTWKIIKIQSKSAFIYLLKKISIRVFFVSIILGFLFLMSKIILNIPFNTSFLQLIFISYLYVFFWFSICFFIISLKKSSNANAIFLLVSWLLLVVFLPVLVSNYITNKYPIKEAFAMTLKQRDGYHKKWDTDKKETLNAFFKHYPQFKEHKIKEKGFSWLWYYAMQQMGDDSSKLESDAMYAKLKNRQILSTKIAFFWPTLHTQLVMNEIANTSLNNHIRFLNATTKFHEDLRLKFYPQIFTNNLTSSINWKVIQPRFFTNKSSYTMFSNISFFFFLIIVFLVLGTIKFVK